MVYLSLIIIVQFRRVTTLITQNHRKQTSHLQNYLGVKQ